MGRCNAAFTLVAANLGRDIFFMLHREQKLHAEIAEETRLTGRCSGETSAGHKEQYVVFA